VEAHDAHGRMTRLPRKAEVGRGGQARGVATPRACTLLSPPRSARFAKSSRSWCTRQLGEGERRGVVRAQSRQELPETPTDSSDNGRFVCSVDNLVEPGPTSSAEHAYREAWGHIIGGGQAETWSPTRNFPDRGAVTMLVTDATRTSPIKPRQAHARSLGMRVVGPSPTRPTM